MLWQIQGWDDSGEVDDIEFVIESDLKPTLDQCKEVAKREEISQSKPKYKWFISEFKPFKI